MRNNFIRVLAAASVLLAVAVTGRAYVLSAPSGNVDIWHPGDISMQINLSTIAVFGDSASQNACVRQAMAEWNLALDQVQFVGVDGTAGAAGTLGNNASEIYFSGTQPGAAYKFDDWTLAMTVLAKHVNWVIEADVILNSSLTWSSYTGPLQSAHDLRRVTLHELGHVLGLAHSVPDPSHPAIMDAPESAVDSLQADDIAGGAALYGLHGAGAPTNDNFGNAIDLGSGGSVSATGTNIKATVESGEPVQTLANQNPSRSVWWKWTPAIGGNTVITTVGSNFDTTLAVYTGSTLASLTEKGYDDDSISPKKSRVSIPVTAGNTYYLAVNGSVYGVSGDFAAYFGQITLNITQAPIITSATTATGTTISAFSYNIQASPGGTSFNAAGLPTGLSINTTTGAITGTPTVGGVFNIALSATNVAGTGNGSLTLAVNSPPAFTGQPTDKSVAAGGITSFSATASALPSATYQWQRLPAGSGTWADLANGGIYSGATTGTLTITAPAFSANGDQFRCVAMNSVAATTSNAATLTVTSVAIFDTQPVDQTFTAGANASFTVSTTGTAGMTYQWQRLPTGSGTWADLTAGGAYSGTTTATLTITGLTGPMNGDQFRCVVTNSEGVVTSSAATLTVNTVPSFTVQPADKSVAAGGSTTFAATVAAFPAATYQWQRLPAGSGTWANLTNGGIYSGVTTATLSISAPTFAANGDQFRCVATNTLGTATSNAATLAVTTAPIIGTQPSNKTVLVGGTTSFAVVASGTPTLTYQWQRLPAGSGTWTDLANAGVYSGVTLATLTITSPTLVMSGDQFRCVVTNGQGSTNSSSVTMTVTALPAVGTQPVAQSVTAGTTTTFSIAASGTPAPTYQWQRLPAGSGTWANLTNAGAYSGVTTTTLTITAPTGAMNGDQFRCVVTNSAGTTNSNAVALSVVIPGALKDFNGDGRSDIVWQNTATGDRAFWLLNGTAIPGWLSLGQVPTAWKMAAVGDFTGDGKPDVVWENPGVGKHSLWVMNGPALASTVALATTATDLRAVAAGDFNADGKPDLVWENVTTGVRTIEFMNGTTSQGSVVLGTVGTDWHIVSTGDFNADAKPDLLWENTVTGDRAIWLMNGTNILSSVGLGNIGTAWKLIGAADFNADGKSDLLWYNSSTGLLGCWLMNGTTYTGWLELGILPLDWNLLPIKVGDFNADGIVDILWQNTVTGDRGLWMMHGAPFPEWVRIGTVPTVWRLAGTADFTKDGKLDLVWENTSTGDRTVWGMNGTLQEQTVSLGTLDPTWRMAAFADFNADKKPDILWQNVSTGGRVVWYMDGTTNIGSTGLGTISLAWNIAAAADFNGDGKPDILWQNTTTGDIGIWLMNGATYAGWAGLGTIDPVWRIAGAADYNGDGKPDILWENTSTGERGYWIMNGTVNTGWFPLGVVPIAWKSGS